MARWEFGEENLRWATLTAYRIPMTLSKSLMRTLPAVAVRLRFVWAQCLREKGNVEACLFVDGACGRQTRPVANPRAGSSKVRRRQRCRSSALRQPGNSRISPARTGELRATSRARSSWWIFGRRGVRPCREEIPGYIELQKEIWPRGRRDRRALSLDQGGPDGGQALRCQDTASTTRSSWATRRSVAAFGGVEGDSRPPFSLIATAMIRDRKVGAEETAVYEAKIAAVLAEKS